MAVTVAEYNHTRKLFANGEIDVTELKVMLLDDHTFSAAHTNISSIEADEVSGGGWTAGGEPIANAAVTVTGTNGATLDGDDVEVEATGAAIGPADGAVIYQDVNTEEYPLFFIDFGEPKQADIGTDFRIVWDENGIHVWQEPAS
jgi:hypothetical protein